MGSLGTIFLPSYLLSRHRACPTAQGTSAFGRFERLAPGDGYTEGEHEISPMTVKGLGEVWGVLYTRIWAFHFHVTALAAFAGALGRSNLVISSYGGRSGFCPEYLFGQGQNLC